MGLAIAAAVGPLLLLEGGARLLGLGAEAVVYERLRAADGAWIRRARRLASEPIVVTEQFPEARAPGRPRLAFVGESTVTGFPYAPSVAFPARIGAALARVGVSVEVINASTAGIGIAEVARRSAELAALSPDLLVVYSGNNEFFPWNLEPARARRLHPLRSRVHALLGGLRIARALAGLGVPRPAAGEAPLEASAEDRRDAREGMRRELRRLVEDCRRSRVPLLVVVPAANLRDAVPKASRDARVGDDVAAAISEAFARVQRREFEGALAVLREAERVAPDHPVVRYGVGRALLELGRAPEARRELERARDLDALPARMTSDLRGVLEEVCTSLAVPAVDAQAVLDAADPTGIAGTPLLVDHVHPGGEAHRLLARAILEAIARRPDLAGELPVPALSEAASRIEGVSLTAEEEAAALRTERTYLFPRAATPGGDPALAARVRGLLEAELAGPAPDPVARLLLGLLEVRVGDGERGRALLREALARGALQRLPEGFLPSVGETAESLGRLAANDRG